MNKRKHGMNTVDIISVYLDCVSVYGGIFCQYGSTNVVICGDVSYTYYNTEDNVPKK